jgi:leucyl aminopeptidase
LTVLKPVAGDLSDQKADLIIHFQLEGESAPVSLVDAPLRSALSEVMKLDGFEGKADTSLLWHSGGSHLSTRYLILGLGKREALSGDALRRASAAAGSRATTLRARRAGVALAPKAWGMTLEEAARIVSAGFLHGGYRFEKYLSSRQGGAEPATLLLGAGRSNPAKIRSVLDEVGGVEPPIRLARDLVMEHPGYLHPRRIAEIARQEAKKSGIRCRVMPESELKRLGMGGMLGVSRGSEHPAVLVHLQHRPRSGGKRKPRVVLVGKGVTFDTGGVSLKHADGMEAMKADMAGAAAVLATLLALGKLRVPVEVHGLMMLVENMPDGRAIRPGDILRIFNGKTVEIKSTDAEGRLILADGLSWACKTLRPDMMLDLATLTGAVVVALGPGCTGVMGNDEGLMKRVLDAARSEGERMWQLPLLPEYREHIHSDVADIKNSGIRYGGAITAGLFLQEFVDPKVPWAHLDIAGPAYFENSYGYAPKGATGHGIRTLLHLIRSLS